MVKSKFFSSGPFAEKDSLLRFYVVNYYKTQQYLFDSIYLIGILEEDKFKDKMVEQATLITDYHKTIKQAQNSMLDRLRISQMIHYKASFKHI